MSQTAIISPNRNALVASPRPIPPQPTNAIPGRSLGERRFGCWAAWASRSRNQTGRPDAAAVAEVIFRKRRREMENGFGVIRSETVEGYMVGFQFQNGIEAVSKFDFGRSRRREESHNSSIERHEAKERAAHVDGRNESGMGMPHP